MVAVKSDVEDFHQPYSDEGEGTSLGEEGDENAGTFQSISTVVLCFNIRSTVWHQFILV